MIKLPENILSLCLEECLIVIRGPYGTLKWADRDKWFRIIRSFKEAAFRCNKILYLLHRMQLLTVVFSSGQSRNSRVILISRKSVRAVHYGTQLFVVGWMIRIWKWRRRRRPTSCHNDLTTVDPPSDPVSMMLFSSISTRPTYLHTSIHPFVSVVDWLSEPRFSDSMSASCDPLVVEMRRHITRGHSRGD